VNPLRFWPASKQSISDMCGIAGIIDFRGRPIDQAALRQFQTQLTHRGPDDAGIWIHRADGFSVGLAHTRLAVIDPSPRGHQPMTDLEGRWAISYNGELYNYHQLREQLPGPLHTGCDTEIALKACVQWGPSAVERFDAMWAMAVVDTRERVGHLSRDPFGIKPLYYAYVNDQLIFASELKTLCRAPGLTTEIDRDALSCYLNLGFIPHPRTIYQDIYKLSPGHRLDFERVGPKEPVRFHRLADPSHTPLDYNQATHKLRDRIESAVNRQRIADVPLGAFLSGGLDSAIVVAALTQGASQPVKTFTIGYRDHPRYDESQYARQVAEHFHTEHYEFPLGFKDILATVEPMFNHLGEPFADSSLLPTALVSRYTREHVTVALSGDGGDELFGGYWRYLGHNYLHRYHRLPAVVRKCLVEPLLRLAPSARTTPWLDRLRQARKLLRGDFDDPIERHLAWARFADDAVLAELLGKSQVDATKDELSRMYHGAASDLRGGLEPNSALDRILLADLAITLPADMLYKVDTASMAHSLEVRVPLLSVDLVDFVTGLPIEYKISGQTTKCILRDAFKDVLPAAVLNRRKMGFEVPVGEFLRNELRDMYNDVVTPTALNDLGLNHSAATRALNDHAARRADHTELLWSLLVLCWWKRSAAR